MGYPVYKLLRAVNRQYPNNGFINPVDVTEDLTEGIIDEDLRDLINETLQETYIHVAVDEVYSFPTVPGQREYVLPEDCDLRDIQEVTRTFRGPRRPPFGGVPGQEYFTVTFYANGGTGTMDPIEAQFGEEIALPACTFTPPVGCTFTHYEIDGEEYNPGDTYTVNKDTTVTAYYEANMYTITFVIVPDETRFSDTTAVTRTFSAKGGQKIQAYIPNLPIAKSVLETKAFNGWELENEVYTENEVANMVVPGDLTFTAHVAEAGDWVLQIKSPDHDGTIIVKTKVYGHAETSETITSGATVSIRNPKGTDLTGRYEYIEAYNHGLDDDHLVLTVDLSMIMTEDTIIPIVIHKITFIAGEHGNLGTDSDSNPIINVSKYVVENDVISSNLGYAELTGMPHADAGYTFRGWTQNGIDLITETDILNMTVTTPLDFEALFEEV